MEPRASKSWIGWAVVALAAPALVIVAVQSTRARRVYVAGSGPIAAVGADDAPEGIAYLLDVERREAPRASAARVEGAIATWPDVVVFGLDVSSIDDDDGSAAYRETLARLTSQAEGALAVPVVVGPLAAADATDTERAVVATLHDWWRLELCRAPGTRICVDATETSLPEAIAAGVREALTRHESWRASTQ